MNNFPPEAAPPPAPLPEPVELPSDPSAEVGGLLAAKARLVRSGRATGSRLYSVGVVSLIAALGYFGYHANVADPIHLYLGLIIFFLAVLPALLWARRARFGLPLFEAFMLPGVNTYAIPLLSGQQALHLYDNDTISGAAIAVIIFQVVAILIYYGVRTRPKTGKAWRTAILSRGATKALGYGMMITTAYAFVSQFTNWIPDAILPEVRAVCCGVGYIAIFVQCRRWGLHDLPRSEKTLFAVQLFAQIIFAWVSLFMVTGVSSLLLALIGYVSGSKKIPFLVVIVLAPVIAILFNGKGTMRVKYWGSHIGTTVNVTDIPGFFSEWIADGVAVGEQNEGNKPTGVLDRTSLIQMMCLVVSVSPEHKPFLMGETYAQIPGQFVPRILWPNKPLGHISTFTLTIYYGLQTEDEVQGTTIGFGMLPEAYANFGYLGMAVLGVALGLFFNKANGWCAESPIFSYPGLFTIVLMAWTFQTELPLSAWLASMAQACECVLGGPYILKNFL
jgi:hypothetical protein